nr:MAG TPA: hypothetical protein [Caudoviricetes sp.]
MMTKIEMEAMEAVIGIHKELARQNEIDWEQRRYEIARNVFRRFIRQHLRSPRKQVLLRNRKTSLLLQ